MPDIVRRILLLQLPVPPPGAQSMEGNVPLAAALLKLHARRQGLERDFEIDIFPSKLVNSLGDQGLLQSVLEQKPDLVGLTCYVWNIERSLWLAKQIKLARPEVIILLGGPEITADNRWVLENGVVDHVVFGEGEAAFVELLGRLRDRVPEALADLSTSTGNIDPLDLISSPYTEDILDAGENRTMLLETVRGCRFQCKYCYYSKRNAKLRFLSFDEIAANLQHAIERGVKEVYLLDPTINQRPDFEDFLLLLARYNAGHALSFSGELRAEGIDEEKAKLLRAANFAELEIGLQSVEPAAHRLMGRPVNLNVWERGVRALMAEGIRVRLDLILGLPGDTVESVRRGIDFLARFRPEAEVQVFNLSILPGTDFRRDAESLGLKYQARPPYYVFQTPTLDVRQMYSLMEEAQETLGIEFDAPTAPFTKTSCGMGEVCERSEIIVHDLDQTAELPAANRFQLVSTLLLRSADFARVEAKAVEVVAEVMRTNPHITLEIVLEPCGQPEGLQGELLRKILEVCYSSTSYLDRYYSMHPGHLLGGKRLFVLLPLAERLRLERDWIAEIGECAQILWHSDEKLLEMDLEEFEHWVERRGAENP